MKNSSTAIFSPLLCIFVSACSAVGTQLPNLDKAATPVMSDKERQRAIKVLDKQGQSHEKEAITTILKEE